MEIQRLPTAKVVFGEDYHSDHSFQEYPASYSFLRATNEVSPYGTNNTQVRRREAREGSKEQRLDAVLMS